MKSIDMRIVKKRGFKSKFKIGQTVHWKASFAPYEGVGKIVWKNKVDEDSNEYQVEGCPYLLWERQMSKE
jgi:heat shock protein HspQ